ncbi:Formate dehydrogenase subunit beta [Desulfamplus magnetovallimortis]|uniref:Formate dehydrogenase subunit beta n=1 Tax=Desulfamplus magnetovallimortis TaxID=1246637 RepID=A0A1W1HFJ3_9BACT|nr:4Fe-4S dicluster domain-containing protein [Desulfamplus magnetovallimortis]SLM31240.1 Formate dehydrogenase subunit beta [Desulfamplus magnetovallimortis]
MAKAFFIDTTLCTACRGCQVACKQWHDLPAEITTNRGTFQNPADLTFSTYKLVRMTEEVIDKKLTWLFFPDQCRHCIEAPCLETAENSDAIYRDEDTGAILYTIKTKELDAESIISSCPYNIPRKAEDGTISKCDMCNDRVHNGLKPACVATCPTGTMNFGEREEMLALGEKRLAEVKEKFPNASLLDTDEVNVIYLVTHDSRLYHEYAMAPQSRKSGISRKVALRKMMKPFASLMRV